MDQAKKKVAMPTDLKTKNRKKILEAFRKTAGRQVTLNEISDMTGISRQTIMKSMGFFLDMGIIRNFGKGTSSELGGKRPELYQFCVDYKYVCCVRIGHRTLMAALVNLNLEIVDQILVEHPKNEKLEVIIENFEGIFETLLSRNSIQKEQIASIGICLGGICNQNTGIMRYNSVYPSWGSDIPIRKMFQEVLPEYEHILITNETKLTAMAEVYYDPSLANKKAIVILTHGGGISAAYVDQGQVLDGNHALAGEIGHMTVDPYSDEACECGLTGCLERMVSEEVLLKKIKEGYTKYPDTKMAPFLNAKQYRLGDVIKALALEADAGDPLALEVTDYMARFMSIGIKNILLNIDPECIIIQGYHNYNGKAYEQALHKYLSRFKYFKEDIDCTISYDKREVNQLAVLGTGYALLEKYFQEDNLYL